MKSKPKRKMPYSETWYAVHNSVRFALVFGEQNEGIMVSKKKEDLRAYDNNKQRIVKIRITEV